MVNRKFVFIVALCWNVCATMLYGQSFTFHFLTDLHVHDDNSLKQVQRRVNNLSPSDLIILGGDIVDVDNKSVETLPNAENLYREVGTLFKTQKQPVYAAIGNHDVLPGFKKGVARDSLFKIAFGDPYKTFEQNGVRFFILQTVDRSSGAYALDSVQINALKNTLQMVEQSQPIVVVTHVPFLSVYYPVLEGKYTNADTFTNQKEVFDLFKNHNLKLVLQGHMHLYEEIKVKGVDFITAGAVSGNWWSGDFEGTSPGHLKVEYKDGEFLWEYVK